MHFLGFVIVDEPTADAVAKAMADFQEKNWDWYRCGGRWDGWLTDELDARETHNGFNFDPKNDDSARNSIKISDLPANKRDPYFVVTPDGYWIPREYWNEYAPRGEGRYGGILPTPDFEKRLADALAKWPDKFIVVVDIHD